MTTDETKETTEVQPDAPAETAPEPPTDPAAEPVKQESEVQRLSKIKIEHVDLLEVENIFLRSQALESNVRLLDQQKLQIIEQLKGLQKDMLEKKKALGEKYNTDMDKVDIDPEGNVKPRVQLPNMPGMRRAMPGPMPGPRR